MERPYRFYYYYSIYLILKMWQWLRSTPIPYLFFSNPSFSLYAKVSRQFGSTVLCSSMTQSGRSSANFLISFWYCIYAVTKKRGPRGNQNYNLPLAFCNLSAKAKFRMTNPGFAVEYQKAVEKIRENVTNEGTISQKIMNSFLSVQDICNPVTA